MPCLVALPPAPAVGHPGHRRPFTSVPRRGRAAAALPCPCRSGRRHLLGASSSAALLPLLARPSPAAPPVDPDAMLERVHPSRADWYEEFYATAMDKGMKSYEDEWKNILELGVGTGPNFKYYASNNGVNVIGVDPNKHMQDYARKAAVSAGLSSSNFTFKRGVAEALPAEDNSMDLVIGTLVLCSVSNVNMALREIKRVLKPGGLYLFIEHVSGPDGSLLRFVQGALDPLQQFVADGCHLTRKTDESIRDVGFSSLSLNSVQLSNAYIISPHVYGVACK
ncbi:hypothetical protein ACP4OV_000279 [Aristida adscensionis]